MPCKPIDNKLFLEHLNALLSYTRDSRTATPDVSALLPFVRDVVLEEVVIYCRGNQAKASRILGLNRGTLRTHMRRINKQNVTMALNDSVWVHLLTAGLNHSLISNLNALLSKRHSSFFSLSQIRQSRRQNLWLCITATECFSFNLKRERILCAALGVLSPQLGGKTPKLIERPRWATLQ